MSTPTATHTAPEAAVSTEHLADDLRASVRDFRDPRTTEQERDVITEWWASLPLHVPNQGAAMLRAAELDAGEPGKPRRP